MATEHTAGLSEGLEDDLVQYRTVSLWAVSSLLLGLASPLALIGPPLWFVPVLGILAASYALRQIDRAGPAMVGRKGALAGLGLSIAFVVAGPVNLVSTRWWLSYQSRPVVEQWFEYLRHDQPQQALQLTTVAARRRPLDDSLGDFYRQPENRADLKKFVNTPVIRTLLALGEKAEIRRYEIGDMLNDEHREYISPLYAVTYDDQGTKKTFFVLVSLERLHGVDDARDRWRVATYAGGVRPRSMAE